MTLALPIGPVETFLLVATRLLAALATSPILSARAIPGPARIGLGLVTALVLVPVIGQDAGATPPHVSWTTIAGEALVGALAGFAATLVYSAVQLGSGLLDLQAGFSMATLYDPTFGTNGALLERFYGAFAALLFLQTDGHHLLLGALRELFVVVPLGAFSLANLQPAILAEIATGVFRVALQLVLPVLGALLLADVALAILARVAPQFNLFAVGLQIKIGLALAALVVALPLLLPRLHALFATMAGVVVGVAR